MKIMFKKKELLIILILAVLVTGLSWFYVARPFALDALITKRGWLLAYWSHTIGGYDFGTGYLPSLPSRWNWLPMVVDFLFWFVVLAVEWWVVTRISWKNMGR